MNEITEKDIEKLAKLSRIELSETEKAEARRSLNAVLAMIDELQRADVSQVDEAAYVHLHGQTLRTRPPTPEDGYPREVLLQNAPDEERGYFLVPKVIE